MSSSHKVRRYFEQKKSQLNATQFLVVDPTNSMNNMRKFQSRKAESVPVPKIFVDQNDEEISIGDESKRSNVTRTFSLKTDDLNDFIKIPNHQTRSFSFSLGSTDETESENSFQPASCVACRQETQLDFIGKNRKKSSIFSIFFPGKSSELCPICKRQLTKTNSESDNSTKRRRSLPSIFQNLFESNFNEEKVSAKNFSLLSFVRQGKATDEGQLVILSLHENFLVN